MAEIDMKISDGEHKFMEVVRDLAPCKSKPIVEECAKRYGWNKSTVYTLLTRLSAQGIVENRNLIVRALVTKEQMQRFDSDYIIKTRFGGSLPSFITAFVGKSKLSKEETEELKKLIDKM